MQSPIEATRTVGTETLLFLKQIVQHLRTWTGEVLSQQILIKRLPVAVQGERRIYSGIFAALLCA